jgi:hypothetical protein
VRHVEGIWQRYNIDYADITCIVTDTEATLVKAAIVTATVPVHHQKSCPVMMDQ